MLRTEVERTNMYVFMVFMPYRSLGGFAELSSALQWVSLAGIGSRRFLPPADTRPSQAGEAPYRSRKLP